MQTSLLPSAVFVPVFIVFVVDTAKHINAISAAKSLLLEAVYPLVADKRNLLMFNAESGSPPLSKINDTILTFTTGLEELRAME